MTFNLIVALVGCACLYGSRHYHKNSILAFRYNQQELGEKYDFRSIFMHSMGLTSIWTLFFRSVL